MTTDSRLRMIPVATGQELSWVSLDPTLSLPRARVDAGGTRLRLRALQVMGHGSARVARAIGADEQAIQKITRGHTQTVSPYLRDAVIYIYDAWWDKRAPERTRHEKIAAATARRRAIHGDWCAPAALDDDELDTPGYQPQHGWLPAHGTGAAADITPPAHRRQTRPHASDPTLVAGLLTEHTQVLTKALTQWANRSQAHGVGNTAARRAGRTALGAIDAMLSELYHTRRQLLTDINQDTHSASTVATAPRREGAR